MPDGLIMMKNNERCHIFKKNVYLFLKNNLRERNRRCVSARGVDANGEGNRNVVGQADWLLHGNGGGRRNVVGQAVRGFG